MAADPRDTAFLQTVAEVRSKCGRAVLDDEDLIVLMGEEISRTTTFEEQNYSIG